MMDINEFVNIKIGDIVVCSDEYSHDYCEHRVKITSIEFEKELETITNPKGMVCYGDDLDYSNTEDYIGRIGEENFLYINKK